MTKTRQDNDKTRLRLQAFEASLLMMCSLKMSKFNDMHIYGKLERLHFSWACQAIWKKKRKKWRKNAFFVANVPDTYFSCVKKKKSKVKFRTHIQEVKCNEGKMTSMTSFKKL